MALKQKIEAAQKDARDGVDASMKNEEHTKKQESVTKLESTVNTGMCFAVLILVLCRATAFVTVRSVRTALKIVQEAQKEGMEAERVSQAIDIES